MSLLLPALAKGQLIPAGPEFQVNTVTLGYQSFNSTPRVGAAADGRFVVVWPDYPGYSISGRRFDSAGTPVGSDFQLRPGGSYKPALAVAPDATFTVVWSMPDADDFGVFAQRFGSGGNPLGTEFQVNSYETNYQGVHQAAADGAGNFLVAWESNLQDGERRGVFAQSFDSTGAPLGSEFQVNSYTAGFEGGVAVTGDPAGGFVVAWTSYRFDGVITRILARRYDSSGSSQGEEFQLNTYTLCFHGNPVMSIAPNGDLVAVWSCRDRDGDSGGIFGRRFDSSGTPLVEEFQVNTHTDDFQGYPAVAHDELGGFLVTWMSDHSTGSLDVFGQRYDRSGDMAGSEFQISTYTALLQGYPAIAALPAGEFAVVWTSDSQDGDQSGVFGQRLRPWGVPLEGKKLVIKNPPSGPTRNKLLFLAKDGTVAAPSGVDEDPRCSPLGSGTPEAGGTIRLEGPGGNFVISLPCSGWIADANRRRFRYRDGTGTTCQSITLSDGRVKARCKGSQVDYSLGSAQDEVRLAITTGDQMRYCAVFGASTSTDVRRDGSNGRIYSATDADALAFCP